jgi:eukaryotic-like serine/threonine-protein kinase
VHDGVVLLDRYTLVARIGEGATSSVWEAIDQHGGERVAVKAISLDEAGWRAEVRDRFQQEARLLALGRHEHLVGVRDVGETEDGFLFIVLEKLIGETLAARIARPPRLDFREAGRVALELARGLAALHASGIVHRDIKPANVILHRDERAPGAMPIAKIIDLGVSKVRAAAASPALHATLTATGQVIGTPEYMSYEQALGARDVDERTDVWAIGVVLYEMLGGRRPFEAPNVNAVLAAIRRGAPPALVTLAPSVPEALVAVVDRCLEHDKCARFRDGAELAAGIEEALETSERQATARTRWKLGTALVGVALVAVAAGAGVIVAVTPSAPVQRESAGAASPSPSSAQTTATAPLAEGLVAPSASPRGDVPTITDMPASAHEVDKRSLDARAAGIGSIAPRSSSRRGASSTRPVTRVDNAGF